MCSSSVESCAPLRGARPCPFRQPSMAGGRPLSQTPRSTTSTGERRATTPAAQNPCSREQIGTEPEPRTPDLAVCDGPRLRLLATNGQQSAGIRNKQGSRRAPDSPPDDEESPISSAARENCSQSMPSVRVVWWVSGAAHDSPASAGRQRFVSNPRSPADLYRPGACSQGPGCADRVALWRCRVGQRWRAAGVDL
jgi:hypothetical protein